MRAGGCAAQQGLASEAAAVVKQAMVLAKRRGHAQVTPLHVANAMLAAPTGLLRVACQRVNSHPLQCKALELCFNVALNRLPASSPGPMISPQHHQSQYPSIANALVAAFKRAQAHQRRGSVENQQQQPLLNSKIELEQLVISILDDPSVSRVMREAGFSSTQVKSNLEKAVVSPDLRSRSSSPLPPCNKSVKGNKPFLSLQPSPPPINQHESKSSSPQNDDVGIIIETLLLNRKRRSLVIVGESISTIGTTVKDLMERVDRGNVPEGLREVKFISIPPLYSLCNLQMDTVEQKMEELTCLVKSLVTKGVVLYVGDLKNWVNDYNLDLEKEKSYSGSVEHMIMELGRLVCAIGETGRLWLMGIATFQTYMKCRNGYHSLESVWGLHPITIPADTLGLSLISLSDYKNSEPRNRRSENGSSHQTLTTNENGVSLITCCADCTSKYEDEVRSLRKNASTTSSQLPPWLKDESPSLCNNDQYIDSIRSLRMKWNSYCSSVHNQRTLITFYSASPSSSTSFFPFDKLQNPNTQESRFSLTMETIRNGHHGWASDITQIQGNGQGEHVISSTETSPSPADAMDVTNYPKTFREFNAQNLNVLCDAMEEKIPWQKEIIPEIAGTVLECRSGMLKRKHMAIIGNSDDPKEDTWLLFLGPDHEQSKQKISRELARLVFGSYSSFASIRTTNSINSPDYSDRDKISSSRFIQRFAQEVSADPHRVFLVEDLEQADYSSRMGIIRAIEMGRMRCENGQEARFWDAIVVLSCNRFNPGSTEEVSDQAAAGNPRLALDLNMSMDEDSDLGIVENIVDRRVVFRSYLGDHVHVQY